VSPKQTQIFAHQYINTVDFQSFMEILCKNCLTTLKPLVTLTLFRD